MENTIIEKSVWLNYVVIDIETTGLDPKEEKITEICALQYNSAFSYQNVVYNNLVNPNKDIPKFITDLTGIDNKMVKYKPSGFEATLEVWKRAKRDDSILVAHNAKFEYDWLTEYNTYYKGLRWICTRALFLYMKDGNTWENNFKKNYSKLKQVCEYFGVLYNDEEAHRAEYDVLKTAEVAEKLIKRVGGLEVALEISKAYMLGKGYGKRKQIDIYEIGEDLY